MKQFKAGRRDHWLDGVNGDYRIIGVLWSYSLRPYSIKQLEDLTVTQSGLTFPLESVYYPALIRYERKDGAAVVTIFKQLAIGPFKGIWWTQLQQRPL